MGESADLVPDVIGNVIDRPDRLIEISGERTSELLAEFSIDGGSTWRPATIYLGASTDEWRGSDVKAWNGAAVDGRIPSGDRACVWNYWFDLDLPMDSVLFRLRSAADAALALHRKVDFTSAAEVMVIDRRNVVALAGGKLPGRWTLAPAAKKGTCDSIYQKVERKKVRVGNYYHCEISNPDPTPLVIKPQVKGWHRIYVGMEPYSAFQFYLSRDEIRYAVPNYYTDAGVGPQTRYDDGGADDRLLQEFYLGSADLMGQDVCVAPGGSRFWRDVSIRYIRLVPMTQAEIDRFHRVRDLAQTRGRPFAGYLEPCTPAAYEPETLTLRDHVRNEMRLNRVRGSTDVYVHVVRIGCKAWYHSDVVERDASEPHFAHWMRQGDPLAVAIEEARAVGLKIFPDAGMNCTYYGAGGEYGALTERFPKEHPEYLCQANQGVFDYRHKGVQEYVAAVVRELMAKYDVDGVNLDFARWGVRDAYDPASLLAVLRQINDDRKKAETKWKHPLIISVRIPYDDPPADGTDDPVFLATLKRWAQAGLVDRVMVCLNEKLSGETRLRHYLHAIAGSKAALWGDLYWGTWFTGGGPQKDLAIAKAWVRQGLNGGFFYYMRARPIEWEQINWQMRLIDFPDVVVDPHHR